MVYSEFFEWFNLEFWSIRSNNGFFGLNLEAQANFLVNLLAKFRVVLQLGIAVRHRLPRMAMPERNEVLGTKFSRSRVMRIRWSLTSAIKTLAESESARPGTRKPRKATNSGCADPNNRKGG
jgi:hypothetical protein